MGLEAVIELEAAIEQAHPAVVAADHELPPAAGAAGDPAAHLLRDGASPPQLLLEELELPPLIHRAPTSSSQSEKPIETRKPTRAHDAALEDFRIVGGGGGGGDLSPPRWRARASRRRSVAPRRVSASSRRNEILPPRVVSFSAILSFARRGLRRVVSRFRKRTELNGNDLSFRGFWPKWAWGSRGQKLMGSRDYLCGPLSHRSPFEER